MQRLLLKRYFILKSKVIVFQQLSQIIKALILSILIFALISIRLEKSLYANELIYDGSSMIVSLMIGRVTEVVFPDKVAKIIKGGESHNIMIEVMDRSVFILPKVMPIPDLFITDVKGQTYPLHAEITTTKYQARIRIVNAFERNVNSDRRQNNQTPLLLLKVMMQGAIPAQAKVIEKNQTLSLPEEWSFAANIIKEYDLPQYRGYIAELKNLSPNRQIIPIEQMHVKGLMAISCDKDSLSSMGEEGDKAVIFWVIKK